nr:unnamed protein product [Naegleria fowleri]
MKTLSARSIASSINSSLSGREGSSHDTSVSSFGVISAKRFLSTVVPSENEQQDDERNSDSDTSSTSSGRSTNDFLNEQVDDFSDQLELYRAHYGGDYEEDEENNVLVELHSMNGRKEDTKHNFENQESKELIIRQKAPESGHNVRHGQHVENVNIYQNKILTSTVENNSEDLEEQKQKVERLVRSAILRSGDRKKQMKDVSSFSGAQHKTSPFKNNRINSIPGNSHFYMNPLDSSLSEEEKDDLQILIPKLNLRESTESKPPSNSMGPISSSEITSVSQDELLNSMLQKNKELKSALDKITEEKNNLEEQFVSQVTEMERYLSRAEAPFPVKKSSGNRSMSRHLTKEELSSINSTLNMKIPNADHSPIVKLSQTILSASSIRPITISKKDTRHSLQHSNSSEQEQVINELRDKIKQIKERYENEKITDQTRIRLTQDISNLLDRLLSNDMDQHEPLTDRTRKLTNSPQDYLNSTASTHSSPNKIHTQSVSEIKELLLQIEIQNSMIDSLKEENCRLKEKLQQERTRTKTAQKNLSQSEKYVQRLEKQLKRREVSHQETISELKKANDLLLMEKEELLQQVRFLRESLQENTHSVSSINVRGTSGAGTHPSSTSSSHCVKLLSDSQREISCSRDFDEPVKDLTSSPTSKINH